jgi:signal transduction histidine kinase
MRTLAAAAALAVLLPLAALLPAGARAEEEYATTKDAELMVHQAIAFLRKEGKEKALAVFNDPKGQFTYRDLYIMAYDLNGTCLAHGAKKERVGKNLMEDRDVDGKQFVKERIAIAKQHGKGWQEYKWQNPVTRKTEQKVAYFERAGDVVVVCGAYKK